MSGSTSAGLVERKLPAIGDWWVLRGSNPRPTPCKGAALPAELSTRVRNMRNQFSASLSALPGRSFGTFSVGKRAARSGRNPRTGATIKIKAAKVPKFRAGKALKDAVN